MKPLLGYSAYLPAHRLGQRVVAGYDEDSTTMAVTAAAPLVADRPPAALYFATSSPAYADKTNACAIHAALGLPAEVFATDLCGTGRSAFAAIRAAATGGGLAVVADVRVGRPGSADERSGGDGSMCCAIALGRTPGAPWHGAQPL